MSGSNAQENRVGNASQAETEGLALSEKVQQWAHGNKSKGKGMKTEGLDGTHPGPTSILPGLLVEEATRSKSEPMEERPVKGPYGDLIRYGRRDKGDGRRGNDGEFPGGKECPPYLYAGGDYRPVYSETKDAWE